MIWPRLLRFVAGKRMMNQQFIRVECEKCHAKGQAPRSAVGKRVRCSSCGNTVVVRQVAVDHAGAARSPRVPAVAGPVPTSETVSASKPSAAESVRRHPRGVLSNLKRRVTALNVKREIAALQAQLDAKLTAAGAKSLKDVAAGLDVAEEQSLLERIAAEIQSREERLEDLAGAKGTSSVAKQLRREIADRRKQTDELHLQIGEKALAAGSLDEGSRRKLSNLQSLVEERTAVLRELQPVAATEARVRTTRSTPPPNQRRSGRKLLVWVVMIVPFAALIIGGYWAYQSLANPPMSSFVIGKWEAANGSEVVEYFGDGTITIDLKENDTVVTGRYEFLEANRVRVELGGLYALGGPRVITLTRSGNELLVTDWNDQTTNYHRYEAGATKETAKSRPVFSAGDLEQTKRWAEAEIAKLDAIRARGNEPQHEKAEKDFAQTLAPFAGQDVTWDFNVQRVKRDAVVLGTVFHVSDQPHRQCLEVCSSSPRRLPIDRIGRSTRLIRRHVN